MATFLDHAEPADLGFPQFPAYRPVQTDLAAWALYGPGGGLVPTLGPRRFMAAGAPAGCGKSLVAHTIGRMSGLKYVVLTATKALQDQQAGEFVDGTDVCDLRGKSNYTCVDWNPQRTNEINCEQGTEEWDCPRAGKPGCTHFDAVQAARRARGVVTNYACWIAHRMQNNRALEMPGEPVGMLICDEAHLAADALARQLAAWVSNEDLHRWAPTARELIRRSRGEEWGRVNGAWVDALEGVAIGARARAADMELEYGGVEKAKRDERYRKLSRLGDAADRVCQHGRDGNWIWRQTKAGVAFDCVWPGQYAERYLWSGVQRIVLMSATLVPKALQLLRIPAGESYFREWPRQFPWRLSPVYWIPNGKLSHGSGDEELNKCVSIGDRLFAAWGRHKGLVHSQSYKRAEWLQTRCEWGRHMFINRPGEATDNLARFAAAHPPAVLVSPSYSTGTDLPNELCRWIWIPKLPFPDRSDPLVLARKQDDPEYYSYETMQVFVQACGRGARHETDWCTVAVTDDNVGNFRNYARRFAPRSFRIEKWERDGLPGLYE